MDMDRFFAPSIQLGCFVADKYVATPNCRVKIEEILHRLVQDKARWHFRRSLFMNKLIPKNLLPTLINVKEDKGILEATIKVLQELMTPVECLMPVHIMGRSVEGCRIINELDRSIANAKKLFLDTKITKALVDLMSTFFQDTKGPSLEECELINHCLLLVRNLLHVSSIPSPQPKSGQLSFNQQGRPNENGVLTEDQIMWNLFAQRFDNVIIQLLTCDQQHLWNITMVQLVSLMYRDQQQGTIRKLINEWLELSLAESSEDDENNPMTSSSSDAVSTSDPVSDSSERLSPVNLVDEKNSLDKMSNLKTMSIGRPRNLEKDDSCKDSGFGRSGSNMDSSPDDSVSEGAHKHQGLPKSQRAARPLQPLTDQIIKDSMDQGYGDRDDECRTKTKNRTSCLLGIGHSLGECDDSENGEKESDGGGSCGSEGGSEGSSPVPVMEQESSLLLIDNSKGGLRHPHFNRHNDQQEIMPEVSVVLHDNVDEVSTLMQGDIMDDMMLVIEEGSVVQKVCSSQEQVKRPPNKEESGSSGDSSEKPPPQLPKLHKPLTGQKRSRHAMSQKMLSETQENNESSNSTGSECDEGPHAKRPHHQKPHKMLSKPRPAKMLQKAQQERNVNRNKLLKRKDINGIKAKALLHHRPTPEDISNLLKEFTIDFILNGYSNLVEGLRLQVMLPNQVDLDKSHLLWLITYFLRFAVELDLEIAQVCPVMSVDVVSYLVYEGVVMHEELESALRSGETNLLPHVRRLHLVVTALREFFVALDVCLKKDHNLFDAKQILRIKEELGQLAEVRQLFVLLIRMYRPGVLNLNYLQDLITTNHRFLTTQEASCPSLPSMPSFNIVNHVKQFATMDMMRQYGRLLENFNVNDETVNDCIFTMMHHVAGDLRNVNVLLQPSILRTFLRIWKEGFELCVDWADLIEYILRKCTRVRMENPDDRENPMFPKPLAEPLAIELTDDDLDQLHTLYKSSSSEQDLMNKIREICCDDSIEEPIKKEVIQKLLARGFITSSECTKLCAEIQPVDPVTTKSEGTISLEIDHMQVSSDSESSMDALRASIAKNVVDKKEVVYKSSNSNDFKMLPPAAPKDVQHNSIYVGRFPENKEHQDQVGAVSDKAEGSVEGNMTSTEDSTDWDENASIAYLVDKLKEEGYSSHIQYLQLQLLEACYSKLKITGPDIPKPEPLALHFSLSNQSVPLIPWTADQEEVFNIAKFRQLLGELGFHLPSDTGKIYPRIPHFWCADVLFMIAKKLGPINSKEIKCLEPLKKHPVSIVTTSQIGSVTVPWKIIDQSHHPHYHL